MSSLLRARFCLTRASESEEVAGGALDPRGCTEHGNVLMSPTIPLHPAGQGLLVSSHLEVPTHDYIWVLFDSKCHVDEYMFPEEASVLLILPLAHLCVRLGWLES